MEIENKNKICFITTVSETIESFILEYAKYIHENTNWDISFICNYDESFKQNLPNYINYYPVHMKRGISLTCLSAIFKMVSIFKREKFNMIQYSTPNASLYASLSGFFTSVPVRLYCQWGIAYVGFKGVKRKIFYYIEKIICFFSTVIEPDSKSNLEFSIDEKLYKKDKAKVIWNGSACGINLNKFNFNNKNKYRKEIRKCLEINLNNFVYGYVGRITKDKGINELLVAYRKILDKHNDINLIIVGGDKNDGTIDNDLFNWATNQGSIKFIKNTNYVEKYLSCMDVFVMPSYREGFGMSIIEAEAMDVPVIVSRIPGPIDAIIEDVTGFFVEKKNIIDLFNKMEKMYLNKAFIVNNHIASKYVKNNFDQEILFNKLLKDRKELLGYKENEKK